MCRGRPAGGPGGRRGSGLLGTRGVPGAGLPGASGVCRGGVLPWGEVAVPGRRFPEAHGGWLFPGRKRFSGKIFSHAMYKEARQAGFAILVDKAIFGPIVWWV